MNTSIMNSFLLTHNLLAVGLTSCQGDPDQLITPDAEATATVSPEIEVKIAFIRTTAGFTDKSVEYVNCSG